MHSMVVDDSFRSSDDLEILLVIIIIGHVQMRIYSGKSNVQRVYIVIRK